MSEAGMIDFSDLEGDLDAEAPSAKPFAKFPCQSCAGTGKYQGFRTHQTESKCFACGGRGWFKTSEADRRKARLSGQERKNRKLETGMAALMEAHGPMFTKLVEISGWHDFARDLVAKANQYGGLTDNQIAAAYRAIERVEAKRKEREAAKADKGGEVDVAKIAELFARASGNGLKRPQFLAGEFTLSMAPANGKNPGAIYVKRSGEYAGKLAGGRFMATMNTPPDTLQTLREIAEDPMAVAVRHGRLTGACACCGRALTDPASIEAGIGPICAAKWF